MYRPLMVALAAAVLVLPRIAAAEDRALTLEQVLEIGRARAPALAAARARIAEARGRWVGASALLRENPTVEGGAGYRWGPINDDSIEGRAALHQPFELGGQRRARMASAEAGISRANAAVDETARHLFRSVSRAFMNTLFAQERLQVAIKAENLAADAFRITERRHQLGDLPRLDVNLARAALFRARADIRTATASREAALGELKILLGLSADEALAIRGDLREHRQLDLKTLEARAPSRADLHLLAAEVQQAQADHALGLAERAPDLGIGASYERHENADIGLGLVSLTLPVFQRGQGTRAEALARTQRVSTELKLAQNTIVTEIRVAFAVYRERIAAVQELERNVLPLLDENESQVQRRYETGQIGLADFLAFRRELLQTRFEYLERSLEAALAVIELEASAGAIQ